MRVGLGVGERCRLRFWEVDLLRRRERERDLSRERRSTDERDFLLSASRSELRLSLDLGRSFVSFRVESRLTEPRLLERLADLRFLCLSPPLLEEELELLELELVELEELDEEELLSEELENRKLRLIERLGKIK